MSKDFLPNVVSDEVISREIQLQIPMIGDNEQLNVANLTELNLHSCGLAALDAEPFVALKHIKKLIVSFNKLRSLKDINNLVNKT